MKWEALGFKDNPFITEPITRSTIALYTGKQRFYSPEIDVVITYS